MTQNHLCGFFVSALSQLQVNVAEFALKFLCGLLVMNQFEQGFCQFFRRGVLLQQFGNQLSPCQDSR